MNDFENIGRKLPYHLPQERLDALRERIRHSTTDRAEPVVCSTSLRRISVMATAVAVVAFVAGIFIAELREQPAQDANFEQMLSTASTETLQQAAAENYDEIIFNQQL